MANPALSNSPAFRRNKPIDAATLEALYASPAASAADIGRMTYQDTAVKTVVLFAVLLATAVVGWIVPALAIVGAIGGLVLVIVNTVKRQPSVPLIVGYAALEGLFVGGLTHIFENLWDGVAVQAVLATMVTLVITLALFASGKVRASARATKVFLIALVGYVVFQVINSLLIGFGAIHSPFGVSSGTIMGIPLGVVIGIVAVLLAAYSLVLDFDMIQQGVRRGLPAKYGWTGAFGLMVTIVWLYVEFLRIFGVVRSN